MILPSSHSRTDYKIYIWRRVAGIHPGPPRWFLHDYGPEKWNKSPWKGWMTLSFGTVWMFSNCRLQFIIWITIFWGGKMKQYTFGHFDGVFPSEFCAFVWVGSKWWTLGPGETSYLTGTIRSCLFLTRFLLKTKQHLLDMRWHKSSTKKQANGIT